MFGRRVHEGSRIVNCMLECPFVLSFPPSPSCSSHRLLKIRRTMTLLLSTTCYLSSGPWGSLLLGYPACQQCCSHPVLSLTRVLLSTTAMVGSVLHGGREGAIGPEEELRRCAIEITGEGGR